jgi:hypothetical protein
MYDAAYFREHAERYRKLADAFKDRPISDRLAMLADESDGKARELCRQRSGALNLRVQRRADRFDETEHMRGVGPPRHRQMASPESISHGRWLRVPGSPRSLSSGRPKAGPIGGAPERRSHDSKFEIVEPGGRPSSASHGSGRRRPKG